MNTHSTEMKKYMLDFPVSVPVTYFKEWQDGFGARGWKVNSTIGDPAVIAATAETGECIPTSVLIHDMLDHYLCGLKMSGHRNEACALIQLASRTESDPTPDFTQMVEEDLMRGIVNGESLSSFINDDMRAHVYTEVKSNRDLIAVLKDRLGDQRLKDALVQRFFDIGQSYQTQAQSTYESHGLDYEERGDLGFKLQTLLKQVDKDAFEQQWQTAEGYFDLNDVSPQFRLSAPGNKTYALEQS